MRKILFKATSIILFVSFLCIFCSCSMVSSESCMEHVGEKECEKCGINYFDELSSIIQTRATSVEDKVYSIEAITNTVDSIIKYDSDDNKFQIALVYKSNNKVSAVFLLTMKPTTGTTYSWALSAYDKIAQGTFQAEDVTSSVFRPNIQNNDFTTDEFSSLNDFYENSIPFCIDVLHSLLSDNENNVKISDFGFKNYSPSI